NKNGVSSFIMYGGTNYFDGPQSDVVLANSGVTKVGYLWKQGSLNSGVSALQLAAANSVVPSGVGAKGHIEMHGNSLFRVARTINFCDQPVVSPDFQVGDLVLDGNAEFSCGDGFSMGKEWSTVTVDLSGNSKLVVGASNGIGNNT